MFYFAKVAVDALSRIELNRIALPPNSDFYFLQPTKRNGPNCSRNDVPPFLPLAAAHEGLGSPPPPASHAGVFRAELNATVPTAIERVAAQGGFLVLEERADAAISGAVAQALQRSRDSINGGLVPPIEYCKFKYFK